MKSIYRKFAAVLAALVIALSLSFGVVSIVKHEASSQRVSFISNAHAQDTQISEAPAKEIVASDLGLPQVDDKEFIELLLKSIGGVKGLGALGIAFLVSKILLFFLLSPAFTSIFPSLEKGGAKLLIACGINVVMGILALMVPPTSLSFGAALVHGSVLAAVSVFSNQAYKYYFAKSKKA